MLQHRNQFAQPAVRPAYAARLRRAHTARHVAANAKDVSASAAASAAAQAGAIQHHEEQPEAQGARKRFNYYAQWYPVAFTADLDKDAPTRFVLLDQVKASRHIARTC